MFHTKLYRKSIICEKTFDNTFRSIIDQNIYFFKYTQNIKNGTLTVECIN